MSSFQRFSTHLRRLEQASVQSMSRGSRILASVMTSDVCSIQRRTRSTQTETNSKGMVGAKGQKGGFCPVYVHHVSKIALEHLQEHRSEWLISKGLHRRLHINPNGTFVLTFPTKKGHDAGKIW